MQDKSSSIDVSTDIDQNPVYLIHGERILQRNQMYTVPDYEPSGFAYSQVSTRAECGITDDDDELAIAQKIDALLKYGYKPDASAKP